MSTTPISSGTSPPIQVDVGGKSLERRLNDLHQRLASETQSSNDARTKAAREHAILLQIQQITSQMERYRHTADEDSSPSPPGRFSVLA